MNLKIKVMDLEFSCESFTLKMLQKGKAFYMKVLLSKCFRKEKAGCPVRQHVLFIHFSFSPIKFSVKRFFSCFERQSSNFVYSLRVVKYIVGQKTELLRFILPSFYISHSNVIHR